ELDRPGPHEVVVKTAASGVCHSDLHFVEGLYPQEAPAILGHEAAGVIESVGSQVDYVKPGDHVIVCTSVFCGSCDQCLTGHPNRCRVKPGRTKEQPSRLRTRDGKRINQFANLSTYAEKMLLHENAVVKIPESMPLDRAALIGCGVTTGVGAALNTAKVTPGSTVAVFGCGGVGLSVVQGAYLAGARKIIAVDIGEYKLSTARQFGATDVVDASKGDPVQQIKDMTGGGVDYAFEAIGLKKTAEQSFLCLGPGGTATVIGMVPVGDIIELPGSMFLQEKAFQRCGMGSNRFRVDMLHYIDFYQQGRLKLDEMISRRIKLEEINEAFRAMKNREVVRSVIVFN
ncbi:MAG: Zn-dependent alcohol dehydrogenase, partial [SAR202 cluster bacterium]|nr:Zn-dependent alcohol dehydrogenase [SAR202 cluster bacterium]